MSTQALRFFARDDAFSGVGVHFMLLENPEAAAPFRRG